MSTAHTVGHREQCPTAQKSVRCHFQFSRQDLCSTGKGEEGRGAHVSAQQWEEEEAKKLLGHSIKMSPPGCLTY